MDSTYNESLNARLAHFLRNEAPEKEAVEMEAAEKEAIEKEATEEDSNEEEDQQALPSGSSNDDGPISPIRFPRVM
jgi:hypothetical protein